jgi:hypothetical protein
MQRSSDIPKSDATGPTRVPAASVLSKIGTLDFVAVLPSGVFTFVVTYLVLSGNTVSAGEPSLWYQVEQMVRDSLGNPLILLCVLFVSYFFGSILRAFPGEWLIATMYVGRRRCPRRRSTDRSYGTARRLKFRVGQPRLFTPRKPDVIPRSIINSWKNALSHRSPEAYAYFRTVEAKSRFAAAMLLAGVLGSVGSVAYITVVGSSVALAQLALISILLTVVFGSLLPKVCRQEVTALLTLSEATRR